MLLDVISYMMSFLHIIDTYHLKLAAFSSDPPGSRVLLVYGSASDIDWGECPIHVYPNGTYDWEHLLKAM